MNHMMIYPHLKNIDTGIIYGSLESHGILIPVARKIIGGIIT